MTIPYEFERNNPLETPNQYASTELYFDAMTSKYGLHIPRIQCIMEASGQTDEAQMSKDEYVDFRMRFMRTIAYYLALDESFQ